jgi:histidine ammonia-lyase
MLNHGFKAVQIGTSAWTAEALKNTMPASVFSRSTECHNQDKVSMGTIAARDAIRVLELTEQVAAATLLAANQGVWLRAQAERPPVAAGAGRHARRTGQDFARHRRPRPGRRTAPVPATYRRATLEAACVARSASHRHGNPRAVL